jgi:galacturonosyltransferase
MSNVLLEAAACGRPLIAADRSGCRETVDDGISGYVVPINNSQAVIDAVKRFLDLSELERKQMGIAGRQKMEKEFDRNIVISIYLSTLKETLNPSD